MLRLISFIFLEYENMFNILSYLFNPQNENTFMKNHADIMLNCILVNDNVRPAMLVQPHDYGEATGDDPKTKSILNSIKKLFPDLLHSETYNTYQGIIISKTNYNGESISLETMGKILGYPCYADFNNIDKNKLSYAIDIFAVQKNNEKIYLFSNACKDETKLEQFIDLSKKAKETFNKPEYASLLENMNITSVDVDTRQIIPSNQIINTLIDDNKLTEDEIYEFKDVLYNSGFTQEFINYEFQFNNPIHKGIILQLLIGNMHDILSPFYPIQNYPIQQKEVDEITKKLQTNLIDILERTKRY